MLQHYQYSTVSAAAAAAAKSLQSCLTLCNPIDRSPPRLLRPWDSPGKNTGVGCHFLLQCMKVKSESEVVQSCPTLLDPMGCSRPGSSVHGIVQARVLSGVPFSQSRTQDFYQATSCQASGSSFCDVPLTLWGSLGGWNSSAYTNPLAHCMIPEWVKVKLLSRVRLLATPWTVAHQAPPSQCLGNN